MTWRTFAAGLVTGALLVVAYLGYRYLTFQPEDPPFRPERDP
jgi:hypothetical protein